MTSAYDLSLEPDTRFLTFRENYTTDQHLMSIYEGIRGSAAINTAGWDMMDRRLSGLSDQMNAMTWAVEEGFYAMAEGLEDVRRAVEDGFQGMYRLFDWGIARICWEHEQDRNVYQDILHVLKHPLETRALELRERAERAVRSKWWEDAATDLQAALEDNRYDYLAHLQLAQVLWFQYGQWEPALRHFALAAKYADAADATDQQRYFAALAYSHQSLLWRMDAEVQPEQRHEALNKAREASARAVALVGELPMAVQEHVLNLLLLGDGHGARRAVRRALETREDLLEGLATAPDVAGYPEVSDTIRDWRRAPEDAAVRLARVRDALLEVARECEVEAAVREALGDARWTDAAPSATPRTCVLEGASRCEAAVAKVRETIASRVTAAAEALRIAQADVKRPEKERDERARWVQREEQEGWGAHWKPDDAPRPHGSFILGNQDGCVVVHLLAGCLACMFGVLLHAEEGLGLSYAASILGAVVFFFGAVVVIWGSEYPPASPGGHCGLGGCAAIVPTGPGRGRARSDRGRAHSRRVQLAAYPGEGGPGGRGGEAIRDRISTPRHQKRTNNIGIRTEGG